MNILYLLVTVTCGQKSSSMALHSASIRTVCSDWLSPIEFRRNRQSPRDRCESFVNNLFANRRGTDLEQEMGVRKFALFDGITKVGSVNLNASLLVNWDRTGTRAVPSTIGRSTQVLWVVDFVGGHKVDREQVGVANGDSGDVRDELVVNSVHFRFKPFSKVDNFFCFVAPEDVRHPPNSGRLKGTLGGHLGPTVNGKRSDDRVGTLAGDKGRPARKVET